MRKRLQRLKVLVVHPYPLVRAGMRWMLAVPDIRVVGEGTTVTDTLRLVRRTTPGVVLMGCHPGSVEGCIELLARIKAQSPSTSVVMLTGSERTVDLSRAMQKGCSGYLSPLVTREELVKAVRAIARGECIIDPSRLKRLFQEMGRGQSIEEVPSSRLTRREHDVLRLVTEGKTNREIAGELRYSVATVKDYVQRIIQKLGVSDRTQAAVKAVRTGLVA
jgi:DNA-binding NarL/FixJ family response regulator